MNIKTTLCIAILLLVPTLGAGCASQGAQVRTAPGGCGYETGFNQGMVAARASRPMNSQPIEARCVTAAAKSDSRRGYREGYILGVDQAKSAPPGAARPTRAYVGGPRSLNAGTPQYEPWYHNELGWSLTAAGVALGVGAVFAQMEYESIVDEVGCEDMSRCASFAERVNLANDATLMRTGRDVLIGLSVGALIGGVVTFIAWRRPMDVSVPLADGVDLRLAPAFSPTTAGLQGSLSF